MPLAARMTRCFSAAPTKKFKKILVGESNSGPLAPKAGCTASLFCKHLPRPALRWHCVCNASSAWPSRLVHVVAPARAGMSSVATPLAFRADVQLRCNTALVRTQPSLLQRAVAGAPPTAPDWTQQVHG